MTKVYPNLPALEGPSAAGGGAAAVEVMTVWRKSLLFNCSGFTVFDADGNLAFRVDNYCRGGDIVLLDATGKPLLTFRRKKLSLALGGHWRVYQGEAATKATQLFSVRKHVTLSSSKTLAHVTPHSFNRCRSTGVFDIEGSYPQRSCKVYGGEGQRQLVAEIQKKESNTKGVTLGTDVFRLVVYPGLDRTVGMAIVILLDQMF